MNINLPIERLVLDGLPIARHDEPLVQAAVEAELVRLLADGGLSPTLKAGGALAYVPASAIKLTSGNNPTHVGQQIAQSVYGGIGK